MNKIINVSYFTNSICKNCFTLEDKTFFKSIDTLFIDEIDKNRTKIEPALYKTIQTLSSFSSDMQVFNYIHELSQEEKYFLQQSLLLLMCHKDFNKIDLDIIPTETLYYRYFSILKTAYSDFINYCNKNSLSPTETLIDLIMENAL